MDSQGIHPGVQGGRRHFAKVNTCANSSLAKRSARALAGVERHLESHPGDGVSQQRASKLRQILKG